MCSGSGGEAGTSSALLVCPRGGLAELGGKGGRVRSVEETARTGPPDPPGYRAGCDERPGRMSRRERRDGGEARGRAAGGPAPVVLGRRRILQMALVLPAAATVLGGCSGVDRRADRPDPLIALADAARADAALAAAAVATAPALAARIDPLREARTQHAAAFDPR